MFVKMINLSNKITRQMLIVLCVISCLTIYCVNQFYKIKMLERTAEFNEVTTKEDVIKVTNNQTKYRLFQPNEAVEFPTVRNGTPRIPHIIHQICDSEDILDLLVHPVRSFVDNNPTWEYRFWTYESGRTFLMKHYPGLIYVYDHFSKNDVKKSDLLRFAVLYEYGGVYADLDVLNLRSLNITTMKYACIVPTEPFEHSAILYRMEVLLSTAVLLCRPKHPFFRQLLMNLQLADPEGHPVQTTGPLYLTKIYLLYSNMNEKDLRKTKIDNSTNSPYFYKGNRPEVHNDAVYIPNSQYFMDDVNAVADNLSECTHKPDTIVSIRELELYHQGCSEFESRKELRKYRTFTFTRHYWFHMWLIPDIVLNKYARRHIKDIIPNCIFYQE